MVTICSRHRVILRLIFSSILMTIDPRLNTRLVHDLYLKSIEGHLLTIDCEKVICTIFFFSINKFPQVVSLAKAVDYFPLRGF
jgi:hypothetical protein